MLGSLNFGKKGARTGPKKGERLWEFQGPSIHMWRGATVENAALGSRGKNPKDSPGGQGKGTSSGIISRRSTDIDLQRERDSEREQEGGKAILVLDGGIGYVGSIVQGKR